MINRVASWIRAAERVAVLTGAGISAESGVPVFRGPGGLWRQFRPEELATPEAFRRQPELVWEWYLWRRGKVAEAQPNRGHDAIARLQRRGSLRSGRSGRSGGMTQMLRDPTDPTHPTDPTDQTDAPAQRRGARLVEVNVEDTPLSAVADVVLRGPAGEVLPVLEQVL